ncbi:hypothetical protein KSP40_PGU013207 [Platanthera guangdongensis]|uniref:Uncharacterized protein n=1 Tax=Platanthera guangdongensis TaxID=2320717 RepID=A0ABR2LGW7_9ASPA
MERLAAPAGRPGLGELAGHACWRSGTRCCWLASWGQVVIFVIRRASGLSALLMVGGLEAGLLATWQSAPNFSLKPVFTSLSSPYFSLSLQFPATFGYLCGYLYGRVSAAAGDLGDGLSHRLARAGGAGPVTFREWLRHRPPRYIKPPADRPCFDSGAAREVNIPVVDLGAGESEAAAAVSAACRTGVSSRR